MLPIQLPVSIHTMVPVMAEQNKTKFIMAMAEQKRKKTDLCLAEQTVTVNTVHCTAQSFVLTIDIHAATFPTVRCPLMMAID